MTEVYGCLQSCVATRLQNCKQRCLSSHSDPGTGRIRKGQNRFSRSVRSHFTLKMSSCCRRTLDGGLSCTTSNASSWPRRITMRHFKYTSVWLSAIRISTLIFPQFSERISITDTIHEMHICIPSISNSKHFCCCHCSCYQHYCPITITVLQLPVINKLSARNPQLKNVIKATST